MSTGEAQSPPDYRYMIRAVADVLAPGNPDDIQNINTAPLPNGAHCYVISRRACFVLNKFSTVAANGTEVLAPIAGGGRWFLEGVATGLVPPAEAFSTNPNTFVADGNLNAPNSALFSLQEGQNPALWTLTAAGCIMTYNGPPTPAIAWLLACVQVDNADAVRQVAGFISVDNDSGGVIGTGVDGVQAVTLAATTEQKILSAQRHILTLQEGSTVRPKFSAAAGAVEGNLESLQLIVLPV